MGKIVVVKKKFNMHTQITVYSNTTVMLRIPHKVLVSIDRQELRDLLTLIKRHKYAVGTRLTEDLHKKLTSFYAKATYSFELNAVEIDTLASVIAHEQSTYMEQHQKRLLAMRLSLTNSIAFTINNDYDGDM